MTFPPTEYRTSEFSIAVKGRAKDDFFVSNIVFNGQLSRLELSQKEVSFQEEFLLRHGKNVIVLQSEDILGKTSSPLTIQVKVDREGPLVFLEVGETANNTILVTGVVYDKSAVAGVTLNNRLLAFKETNFLKVEEQFNRAELEKGGFLRFEAEDVVGNKTRGCLNCDSGSYSQTAFSIGNFPQVASSKPLAVKSPSGINLRGLRNGLSMYLETFTVEGTVQSHEGIEELTVNRESLLSLEENPSGARFLKLLREKRGRPLTFSKTIQLKEGNNPITTTLTNATGAITGKDVTIIRNIPKVRQMASRLSVSIFPFTDTKKTGSETRNYIHTFLNRSFQEQKRFNVLGRDKLNTVLEELRVSRKTVFDEDKAVRLGRLMDADTVLVGNIVVSKASVEIIAHLLDTQTSSLITEKDVYWEGELTAGFRGILDRLALKFKDHIPLCEGSVTETLTPRVVIDLGSDLSIHKGMRFLAYREEDPLIDDKTGMNLGSDTEVFGLLAAEKVDQTFSRADVVEKFTKRGVQTGDKVISK